MKQIVRYVCEELENAAVSCLVFNSEPWFNGAEVATALGHKQPRGVLYDHVPLKHKNKLRFLVSCSKVPKTKILDVSDLNASWISEAGLYKLILKSKAKHAGGLPRLGLRRGAAIYPRKGNVHSSFVGSTN